MTRDRKATLALAIYLAGLGFGPKSMVRDNRLKAILAIPPEQRSWKAKLERRQEL